VERRDLPASAGATGSGGSPGSARAPWPWVSWGSELHNEFAAIGDTTNVAARLYAAALKMGVPVLISETTMSAGLGAIQADPLPPLILKGKSQPVPVFQAREVHLGAPGR